ncbi:hypothetical protein Tco_1305937 [Tanacetum coccineum]
MKYVFGRSRGEDDSFAKLMRDLCFALRISLSKKRRLVAELEALGKREGNAKPLENTRDIVARDAVTLRELVTLLARAQVGVSLKVDYVADMEENILINRVSRYGFMDDQEVMRLGMDNYYAYCAEIGIFWMRGNEQQSFTIVWCAHLVGRADHPGALHGAM